MSSLITFITDFGTKDGYVAAMQGTILSINPDVRFLDISHHVAPQDIMEAAFLLKNSYEFFPANTIHLVITDPQVGTNRRAVALRFQDHYFIGPDNGIFSLLLEEALPDELVVLDKKEFWRTYSPSPTFHGRDIFAPVAAHLASGKTLSELGSPLDALERMYWASPVADAQGIQGWVIHIDHYGNCITNITADLFNSVYQKQPFKCYIGSSVIRQLSSTYADADAGSALALFGSHNFLEVAINQGNAATLLSIEKGNSISIVFHQEHTLKP